MQKNLESEESSTGSNSQKSEIIELDGEGDRFEKSLRDRATGLERNQEAGEIEVL